MTDRSDAIQSMFGPLLYGVRYIDTGSVQDFEDDSTTAIHEVKILRGKGVAVELVQRKVGPWRRSALPTEVTR